MKKFGIFAAVLIGVTGVTLSAPHRPLNSVAVGLAERVAEVLESVKSVEDATAQKEQVGKLAAQLKRLCERGSGLGPAQAELQGELVTEFGPRLAAAKGVIEAAKAGWDEATRAEMAEVMREVERAISGEFLQGLVPGNPATEPTEPPVTANVFEPGLPTGGGEIKISLSADKESYHLGELMHLSVEADTDCFLRIYYLSVEKKLIQIFPNDHDRDNRVAKGKKVLIPPADNPKFRFRMTEPLGKEALVAVASLGQFTDIQDVKWVAGTVFPEFDDVSFRSMLTRGIEVESVSGAAPKASWAKVIYEVKRSGAPPEGDRDLPSAP